MSRDEAEPPLRPDRAGDGVVVGEAVQRPRHGTARALLEPKLTDTPGVLEGSLSTTRKMQDDEAVLK